MKLKNVLIVVDDIEESLGFYKEIFGLQVILRQEGNVIMSEGLVLQDRKVWCEAIGLFSEPCNNAAALYFEDSDLEAMKKKMDESSFLVRYVTELTELDNGQKLIRFYDPSGNLIEVRTPVANFTSV